MGTNKYPIQTLLVEPDSAARKYLTRHLRERGYTVRVCQDPLTAWQVYDTHPYSLIIVEWQLPGSDCIEFIRKVRAHPLGQDTMIAVIAANEKPENLEPFLEAGIDDYISVPLYPPHLDVRLTMAEQQLRRLAMPEISVPVIARCMEDGSSGCAFRRIGR